MGGGPAFIFWQNELLITFGKLCLNIFQLFIHKFHRYKSYFKDIDFFIIFYCFPVVSAYGIRCLCSRALAPLLVMFMSCLFTKCVCIFIIYVPLLSVIG